MFFYDISRDLTTTPPYPGDIATSIVRVANIGAESHYNISEIHCNAHSATHIDAPMHSLRTGKDVSQLDLSIFYGECSVISIQGVLTGEHMDKILPYCKKRVLLHGDGKAYISSTAVDSLVDHGVLLVGTDADSIGADFEEEKVHYQLLRSDIVILENLNLSSIKDGVYLLNAFPLKITGCEAAPCRAVLIEGEKAFIF